MDGFVGQGLIDRFAAQVTATVGLLRGCSSFESEGERDAISRGFGPAFEVRSSATGRESGIEDAERPRVQPRSKT